MGKRSLELSKNFTLEVHTARTLAFYNSVLNSFPKPVSDDVLKKAVALVVLNKSEITGGVLTCKKFRRLVFAHSPSMRHLRLCGGRA